MFDPVININYRYQSDVFPLVSVTFVTFNTKLQIMTLYIVYKNELGSQTILKYAF